MAPGQVVLVRPWTDSRGAGGCCSGASAADVCTTHAAAPDRDGAAVTVAAAYERLRAQLPDVDVQVVTAGNTAYLLPTTYRAVRRRSGTRAAIRAAVRSTTAGAVLVDGEVVGDLTDLGPAGVVAAVRHHLSRSLR